MQQNTWKYFPFPKIAFPKNILHEPNGGATLGSKGPWPPQNLKKKKKKNHLYIWDPEINETNLPI